MSPAAFVALLTTVPEPRVARTRVHRLEDILAIALLAAINGADGWEEIADFGESREKWLRGFSSFRVGCRAPTPTDGSSRRSTRRRWAAASPR